MKAIREWVVVASNGHSYKSDEERSARWRECAVVERGGIGLAESELREWATGTLTRWMKGDSGSCYLTPVLLQAS
ncbi:hypothetical protein EVAR_41387_1 [Eumeta japonica]|uniref:Uncharacterized protein n=1 Tax=Eumeta variegata TaxID=151549 RepID=A0A4C1WXV8_EUMVA|nr:hypothetical protein EVAR_41387_1 [Eumeta japonica]